MKCPCLKIGSEKLGPASTLLDDIKRLQSNEAFLDMVFVCGSQEEEIAACRMWVAARSAVLQSMLLTSGMAESQRTRISLPHIHPTTMRICLEFFHTDTVQESSWTNISMAMHVLEAATFFLVERLQVLALAYLERTLRNTSNIGTEEWWPSLVSSYNLVVEIKPRHESDYDLECHLLGFLRHFGDIVNKHVTRREDYVKLLTGANYERHFYQKLTEPALFHFIQYMCDKRELPQYLSFLHVVRWSAYRALVSNPSIDEAEFREVLNKCFPKSTEVMRTMLSSAAVDIPFNDTDISRCMKLLADPLADCLQRAPIDFAKMPSKILCRFIEPLNILSPSALLAAYRCQALRSPNLVWDALAHGSHYILSDCDSTVISCSSSRLKGFARCSTYLTFDTDFLLDWEVVILKPCADLRIGFCKPRIPISNEDFEMVLGDTTWSWALGADGFLHHNGKKSSTSYVGAFLKEGATVGVQLDTANSTCSFSIDNKYAHFPLITRNVTPSRHIYPAISLVAPGRAQIKKVHYKSLDRLSEENMPHL